MNETQAKTRLLSRFDMLILLVVVALAGGIALLNFWDSPENKGALVAYLYPLSSAEAQETVIPNIWIASVAQPEQAQAVTASKMGVFDFGVSPDGRFIVYSERDERSLNLELWLLDLQTSNLEKLTDCTAQDSDCSNPVFHPNGTLFAYTRQVLNRSLENVNAGVARIWLLDLKTRTTNPLSQDSQMIGHSPVWSQEGNTIAFFSADLSNQGIFIYNFNAQAESDSRLNFVPASNGTTGALAPNGQALIFPDTVDRGGVFENHLKIVDFSVNPPTFRNFTERDGANNDTLAVWHPNGKFITLERQYNDERWTQGFQVYLMDIATQAINPLLYDEHYAHGYLEWNRTGDKLLVQRLPLFHVDGSRNRTARPEIWVLDYETGALTRISERAYHPRWILP